MNKLNSFKNLGLAVCLATLCLNASAHDSEQLPFKGTFDPIVVSTTSVDATHVRLEFDVHVRASQLGKARGPGFSILDLNTLTYVGEATWVGRNGDSIRLAFTGQFRPTGTIGLFDNFENVEIIGGTGRFEGATGTCVAGGQYNFITKSAPAPAPFKGTLILAEDTEEE